MKRQLPKNVRQIGNVSDSTKIYVEDYVDTFFNQLSEKVDQAPIGAFLVGEIVQEQDEDYIYVYGAIRMKDVTRKGREIFINDNTWKHACEKCKQYFGDAEILGWFLTANGQAMEANHNIMKIHQKYFSREKSLFVVKEPREGEEKYFVYKFKNLMESGGHYVYYEKNTEMQDYMISMRKKNGITPSEIIEDTVTKNFRNVIRNKMEKNEKKTGSRYVYALSTFLVLVVIVAGVAALNNYDKLQNVKSTIDQMRDSEDAVETLGGLVGIGDSDEKEPETPEEVPEVSEVETPEPQEPEVEEPTPQQPEEAKPEVQEPAEERTYIVQEGDTLASISIQEYGNINYVDAICERNGLEDGNLIMVGQKLVLP